MDVLESGPDPLVRDLTVCLEDAAGSVGVPQMRLLGASMTPWSENTMLNHARSCLLTVFQRGAPQIARTVGAQLEELLSTYPERTPAAVSEWQTLLAVAGSQRGSSVAARTLNTTEAMAAFYVVAISPSALHVDDIVDICSRIWDSVEASRVHSAISMLEEAGLLSLERRELQLMVFLSRSGQMAAHDRGLREHTERSQGDGNPEEQLWSDPTQQKYANSYSIDSAILIIQESRSVYPVDNQPTTVDSSLTQDALLMVPPPDNLTLYSFLDHPRPNEILSIGNSSNESSRTNI